MKPSDFMPDKEHTELNYKPPMQADLDSLKAMYQLMMHNLETASKGLQAVNAIDNNKTTEMGPLIIVEIGPPGFHGVTLCKNCASLTITALRDAAQALEDILAVATTGATAPIDKPGKPA